MSLISSVPREIWFAAGISLVAVFLGLWQWFDQRSRDLQASPEDHAFFRRQDRRRYFGVAVMAALALFLVIGSITLSRSSLAAMVSVWAIVCGLIAVLCVLALIDAVATQKYARRQFKALAQERTKIMLEAISRPQHSAMSRRPPDTKGSGAPEI